MGQTTAITLVDHLAANVVFNPVSATPGKVVLEADKGTTGLGSYDLIYTYRPDSPKVASRKTTLSFAMPIELGDATSGYRVEDTARATLSLIVPIGLTAIQRDEFLTLVRAAIAHAVTEGYVNSDPMY